MVAQHRMRQGPCSVLRQNPWNGVLLTGHANGTVSMWTPNLPQAAVKMLCHQVRCCRLPGQRRSAVLRQLCRQGLVTLACTLRQGAV